MNWLSQIFGFLQQFQFWIVIAPWETALRVRLGKDATILSSGPHLRIPFFDRIFVQSARLRTISDDGQTIATKDGKVLTLAVALSYAIGDIRKLYLAVSNPEATLLHQIQGWIAEIVCQRTSAEISPKLIEDMVGEKMPSTEWGLEQVKLMVVGFAFVRTYRLLNSAYRTLSSANDLEASAHH